MIKTNLFHPTDAHKIVAKQGNFAVLEYLKDFSVKRELATTEYFSAQMNYRRRQVIGQLNGKNGIIVQAGEMQFSLGNVKVETNIDGLAGFVKNAISSRITKETTVKPLFTGEGLIVLEPTYRFILLVDLDDWGGSMVIEDRMFLACDNTVKLRMTSRDNLASVVLGNEGIFNTELVGKGIVALESEVPEAELILVELENDVIRIDGSIAIAWSSTLNFTVEKTTETIIGSLMTKENFLNVYRGTGRVLIAPVRKDLKNPKERIE